MKRMMGLLLLTLALGTITVQPSRKWALSLTPVRPERLARQDVHELCPAGITLRGAPVTCLMASIDRHRLC
jgi:hypothetical protein